MQRRLGSLFLMLVLASALAGCSFSYRSSLDVSLQEYSAPRTATLDLAGINAVRIDAEIGNLRIEGVSGLKELTAEGMAVASVQSYLDRITLTAERRGTEAVLTTRTPEGFNVSTRRLDLTIRVPDDRPLTVALTVGTLEIRQMADVPVAVDRVAVGTVLVEAVEGDLLLGDLKAGTLTVRGVGGDLRLASQGAGTVQVSRVNGDVLLESVGAGTLTVADVGGDLRIRAKGVGTSVIHDVGGSVVIDENGLGTVDVHRIKGDLIVKARGLGNVTYGEIGGKVEVPSR